MTANHIDDVTYHFMLPYIVQPEGVLDLQRDGQPVHLEIKHHVIAPLLVIITGFQYDPEHPVGINGPSEIFKGVSEVELTWRTDTADMGGTESRNRIADLLNDCQYCYLHCSGKAWGHSVSADHFINIQVVTATSRGMSSDWGGSHRQMLSFLDDKKALPVFKSLMERTHSLPPLLEFLVDAKRHYVSGEYHLMYVELAAALEALANRAYKKISSTYEHSMFKEGKLQGQVAFLLYQYCKWDDTQIEPVIAVCTRRNEVVHDSRRSFRHEEAYAHLMAGENAIKAINDWISI